MFQGKRATAVIIDDLNYVPARNHLFATNEAVRLYRGMLSNGIQKCHAKETVELITGDSFLPQQITIIWRTKKNDKQSALPFYHHKRRF